MLADVFEKNEKENKTTSVYRLANNTRMPFILFTVVKNISPSYSMYVDVCRPQQLTFLKVLILKCRLALDPFNTTYTL